MSKKYLLVNGLPEEEAILFIKQLIFFGHLLKIEFDLLKTSLASDCVSPKMEIDGIKFNLIYPWEHQQYLEGLWARGIWPIIIELTRPWLVNNTGFYCERSFPFITNIDGHDREQLEESVKKSETCAMIVPNMAVPNALPALKFFVEKIDENKSRGRLFSLKDLNRK